MLNSYKSVRNRSTRIGQILRFRDGVIHRYGGGDSYSKMRIAQDRIASKNPSIPTGFLGFYNGICVKEYAQMNTFEKADVKPLKDLSGKVFGSLFVNEPVGRRITKIVYKCSCTICGTITYVSSDNIQRGQACGCLKGGVVKHGMAGSIEYKTWVGIKRRCTDKNNEDYANYGGRGITLCQRWFSFENFLKDMGMRPKNKESIDRKDNNLGYFSGNCRWANKKQQNRNKRNNKYITHNGKTLCIGEWAEKLGMSAKLIQQRISRGVSVDRSLQNINLVTGKRLKTTKDIRDI